MEGLNILLDFLLGFEFFIIIDFKDVYFMIFIYWDYYKYLRFEWNLIFFEFICLFFGFFLVLRVFIKVLKFFVGLICNKGIRLVIYFDDMVIISFFCEFFF